jgi:hypothetical protein
MTAKTAAPKTTKPAETDLEDDGLVRFNSTRHEPVAFDFGGFSPARLGDGRLQWRIPADRAEAFDRHHWVETGRIARAGTIVA